MLSDEVSLEEAPEGGQGLGSPNITAGREWRRSGLWRQGSVEEVEKGV